MEKRTKIIIAIAIIALILIMNHYSVNLFSVSGNRCSVDSDCYDNKMGNADICINPGASNSYCKHSEADDELLKNP